MKTSLYLSLLWLFLSNTLFAQIVNIPDANFKAALVSDLTINTNNDTEIQVTEATAYTGTISVANQGIVSMEGIEAFVNLAELECSNNTLSSLDLSANIALTSLYCNVCQLPSLDVSANINLLALSCYNNQLTVLDVNSNTLLEEFYAYNNQLTNLDLSNQTAIRRFFVQSNQLVTLNFKNGNYINVTHFNAITNPDLTCIEVDDVTYSTTNWDHIDNGVVFSNSCFTSLDLVDNLEVIIYPNPVSKNCILELPYTTSKIELILYNTMGQELIHREYRSTNQITLDLEDLNLGAYWLSLTFEGRSLQYPILKR